MKPPPENELFSAYLDGELTPGEQERMERLLDRNSDAALLVDALRTVSEAIQSLPAPRMPVDLTERVLAAAQSRMRESAGADGAARAARETETAGRAATIGRWLRRVAYPAGVAVLLLIVVRVGMDWKNPGADGEHRGSLARDAQNDALKDAENAGETEETQSAAAVRMAELPSAAAVPMVADMADSEAMADSAEMVEDAAAPFTLRAPNPSGAIAKSAANAVTTANSPETMHRSGERSEAAAEMAEYRMMQSAVPRVMSGVPDAASGPGGEMGGPGGMGGGAGAMGMMASASRAGGAGGYGGNSDSVDAVDTAKSFGATADAKAAIEEVEYLVMVRGRAPDFVKRSARLERPLGRKSMGELPRQDRRTAAVAERVENSVSKVDSLRTTIAPAAEFYLVELDRGVAECVRELTKRDGDMSKGDPPKDDLPGDAAGESRESDSAKADSAVSGGEVSLWQRTGLGGRMAWRRVPMTELPAGSDPVAAFPAGMTHGEVEDRGKNRPVLFMIVPEDPESPRGPEDTKEHE